MNGKPTELRVLEWRGNARKNPSTARNESDRKFFVVVFDLFEDFENLGLNEEFLLKFPDQSRLNRLSLFKLSAGKFPKTTETFSLRSLGEKKAPGFVLNDGANNGNHIEERFES